jgi:SPP1 gp7 family putative phage head morphogenesis protein
LIYAELEDEALDLEVEDSVDPVAARVLAPTVRAIDAKPRWNPSLRTEAEYADSLWRGFVAFLRYCASHGASPQLVDATAVLGTYAYASARAMVTGVLNRSSRTWREAARRSGRTDKLYNALRTELEPGSYVGERYHQLVESNSRLISTFPTEVAARLSTSAAFLQRTGGRSGQLAATDPDLLAAGRKHARMVARTEVSKASVALTRARSEEMDLPWYVWRDSEDQRVRPSHRLMNGVLVNWSDPPSPERLAGEKSILGTYNAGEAPNDRCYPEPLVSTKQISWPHKAYLGGRIQRVTLGQFRAMNPTLGA